MKFLSMQLVVSLLVLLAALSCSPKFEAHFISTEDIVYQASAIGGTNVPASRPYYPCKDPSNYIPDTTHLNHTPIRFIRVNVHWMNSEDSTKNYNGEEAVKFARGMLRYANNDLKNNRKMWLPHNNNTPVITTQYRYVLTPRPNDPDDDGIYFHYDDELFYHIHKGKTKNLYKRAVFEKYGVQLDTVLNLFVMPHHPDSIASPTYNAYGVGVALGNAVKLSGIFESGGKDWVYRGLINHEIGHIYGLTHTWAYNDGCDDTPKHPQKCWNRTKEPPCDTMASNNVMDYNALQNAFTPCQIGKVHYRMASPNSRQRKFLIPKWCDLKEKKHIFIKDTIVWNCMKDLESHITIEDGGKLTMRCRISLPKGAKITVKPGGTLVLDDCQLHNACGEKWQGIEVQSEGKKKGEVVFLGEPKIENARNAIAP